MKRIAIVFFVLAILMASCTPVAGTQSSVDVQTSRSDASSATLIPTVTPTITPISTPHWIDETGRISPKTLVYLEKISSERKIPAYGVFVNPDDSIDTCDLADKLGAKRGLIPYPDNPFPAITVGVIVAEDGTSPDVCPGIWQSSQDYRMMSAYYLLDIANDDSIGAIVEYVDLMTSEAPLVVTYPENIPSVIRNIGWITYHNDDSSTELPTLKEGVDYGGIEVMGTNWTVHIIQMKDEYYDWIEIQYREDNITKYLVRMYPDVRFIFSDVQVEITQRENGRFAFSIYPLDAVEKVVGYSQH